MQVSWTQILVDIANNNPLLFVIIAMFVVLIPKTFDYIISAKKIYKSSDNDLIENFSNRLNKLQDRCDKLQAELDDWKHKYYSIQNELTKLEMLNKQLNKKLNNINGKEG